MSALRLRQFKPFDDAGWRLAMLDGQRACNTMPATASA